MKKMILVLGALLALSAAFAMGVVWQNNRSTKTIEPETACNTPTQEIHVGSALLTGRITSIKSVGSKNTMAFQLVDMVNGHDAGGQAALEVGVCTLERLENYECTPNAFFIRETQKQLEIPLAQNVLIQVRTPGPNGEIKLDDDRVPTLRNASLEDLKKMLENNDFSKHALFKMTTADGTVTKIQEQYLP